MAVTSKSSRSDIKAYQKSLNAAGAKPPLVIDGIWGPKTQAAHDEFGEDDEKKATGTKTSKSGSELLLPGSAQLWYNSDTDTWYVVYEVPGVRLPDGTHSEGVHTAWEIESDADLTAVLGPGNEPVAAFVGGNDEFTQRGLIDLGGVDELRNFDGLEGDPFDTWVEDLTVLAQTRPWLLDDDYVALAVQAAMERADGAVSLDEIKTTKWWRENSVAERAWMETVHSDPATADQMLEDNRNNIRYRLAQAGIANASDALINYVADQTTMGHWSNSKLESQIAVLADPHSVEAMDSGLMEFLANEDYELDHTQAGEDTVRNLLQEWLGPVYGNWSEEDIAKKAGEIRNDPDAEQAFTEYLKDQRMAVYGNYSDREVSYAAAARPWSTFLTGQWGMVPDETDDVFQEIVQMNDPTAAGQLARRTGFDRGYEKSVNDVIGGVSNGSRSNVIGAT